MGYKDTKPVAGGASPFAQYGSFLADPNFFDYKKELKVIGESVELRFFGVTAPFVIGSPAMKVAITNPKDGKPMNLQVYEPSAELMHSIRDHNGKTLAECDRTTLYRMIVWVKGKNMNPDRSGNCKDYEAIGDLRYLEFTPGLAIEINKLQKYQNGAGAFNENTGRPDYDIRFSVVPGNSPSIPKNYALEPIRNIGIVPKTKRPLISETFGVDTDEALGKDLKVVEAKWDEVMEAMHKLPDDEAIKRRFSKTGGGVAAAMGSRGGYGGGRDQSPPMQTSEP